MRDVRAELLHSNVVDRKALLIRCLSPANRALELKYVDGTCTLAVPLPLNGFDEERVFSFPPGTDAAGWSLAIPMH